MRLEPGTVLGSYRIVSELGRGGMATVYKAYQTALARNVAVKVLPEYFAEEPGFKERFQQEAIAVANLRHRNIPAVHDYGESDGVTYIVSEYIDGGTLTARLGKPLPLEYALQVLSAIGEALDYAHSRGVLHRDVKPSNVLLERDGTPVLADFGLAKMMASDKSRLTRTGMIVGTPEYMSPEQCEGDDVSPASDQYALGVVAYEMLTGRPPFVGPTPVAVILSQVKDPLPPPRSINPAIPESIGLVLQKALAKRSADRYGSCAEFVRELKRAAAEANVVPASGDSVVLGAVTEIEIEAVAPDVPEQDLIEQWAGPTPAEPEVGAGLSVDLGQSQAMAAAEAEQALQAMEIEPAPHAVEAEPAPPVEEIELAPPEVAAEPAPEAMHPEPAGLALPAQSALGHISGIDPGSDAGPPGRRSRRPLVTAIRSLQSVARPSVPVAAVLVLILALTGAVGFVRLSQLLAQPVYTASLSSPSASAAASPTVTPVATASPTPSGSPSPAVAGTVVPHPTVSAAITGSLGAAGGHEWIVIGSHFTPGKGVTVNVYDPANSSQLTSTWPAQYGPTIQPNGTFRESIGLAGSYPHAVARIVACDTAKVCASTTINAP